MAETCCLDERDGLAHGAPSMVKRSRQPPSPGEEGRRISRHGQPLEFM